MNPDWPLFTLKNDLINNILAYASDINQCARHITTQIREIIGTRIVALCERNHNGSYQFLAACPERKGELFKQDEIARLVECAGQFERATLIEQGKGEAGYWLLKLDLQQSFAVPLQVGGESVGLLLLLDLMDAPGSRHILEALQDISGILSLVLKNSYLYRNMEELVEQRTRQLQESEMRSQIILQTAMDGFWCVDAKGQLIEVNDAYCEMSGFARNELIGLDIAQLDITQTPKEIEANVRNILAGKRLRFETTHRQKNGDMLAVEINAQLRPDSENKEIIVFLRDITERKRTETALIEALAHYRTLIDTIPDLIWLKDLNGVYLSCNRTFERFFGAREADILGKTDYDFVDADLADFFRAHDQNALYEGRPCINEESVTFAEDGYHCLLETIKTPVYDAHGVPIGVLGIARDITERKQAENSLKESEKRYKSAQRLGKVGNWEYNIATQTFWGSDQAKSIYGFDPESKDFTVDQVESCILERERVHQALEDLIERGIPYNLEFEIHPISGPPSRIIRSIAEVERDAAGNALKIDGVIQDISQQKKAENEKLELERQLRQSQKMEAVGQLAGGVAHDFNNMLSVIQGYTEMALEELDPTLPLYHAMQQIYKASLHSADITRQLLAFARKQTIAPKVVDLNETIEGTLKMLRRLIGENIALHWLPGANLWPIKIDPTQIDQILANLCVNARDAIGGIGNISVETKNIFLDNTYSHSFPGFSPGDYVRISVSDNGCGIPKEILPRIFEPFFTTKLVGEGTGLGLATVYGAVRQNEGFINAYSEPGKGTTFTLYLPRFTDITKITNLNTEEQVVGGNETILLVENEEAILKMTTILLGRLGYTVIAATTPEEAISLVENSDQKIDLLLTDLIMPEMNGRELAERILSLRPEIRYFFMSGYTANIIADQGVLDQGVSFLQKPFTKKELAEKIRDVLK
ncbi:hybrid sensor histidine kinase/response regulator [Desulfopila aestuarii]|uniref:histidine kinase n=1 Tax=Desulfopila aestuarii DSM 18488 TaxID=1121416 RepID=A0A1M7Y5V1_9BACT|nr:PAS domain-containing sensor histidine kinase [Desulfopila aestuarii]SHO47921.1 PAS domain S-box-containing protein [Desulfopila aestuarii DSM 18488]